MATTKKQPSILALAQAAAKKQQSREEQAARMQAARRLRASESISGAIGRASAGRPAAVSRQQYQQSQGIDRLRKADAERRQRLQEQAAHRSALEQAAANRANALVSQYRPIGAAPVQNDPLHDRLVQDIAATGRLPSGYSWYGKGSDAIAVDNRGLAYKPLEGVTAGSRAATPSVYGIDPDKYLQHMQAYDAWEAEKGNLPNAAKRAQEYLQPAIEAETDPVRKAELQKQLDAAIASAAYSPAEQRKRSRLEKAAMEAVGYLGEDVGQYAGRSDMDYLRSFGQQFGIQQEGAAYGESYRQPWFQRKGSDAAVHADLMQKLKMGEVYGDINPYDALETGDSQLLQSMSDDDKAAYMGIASRYGVDTARAYWDAMKQEGQYGQKAYSLRDAAYRDMADKSWLGSSALSVASNVASISGTLYGFAQKMTGKEIDPYADQFMFGQMTGAIRDEVGQNITRNFGNEDGTDNFGSWLMKTGYNAGMSSLDSLVAGQLSGGSALAGSMMQGFSGASSVIQDAKLRGATDEQALLLGGLSVVTETATEYIPMDTLLETIDGKDVVNFRQLLTNALKGGLSEAPGEGLSEVLSVISDNQIMGAMSNYNLNVEAYMRTGMTEDEARRKASGDVIWDVFNAAATGFLSGEGSNLMAGSRSLAANALMPNNTADYQGTVEAVRKLAETTGDAELRTIAEKAGQEMSHTGTVEAAKRGVVDRMMAAADAVVAKQQNTAQSAAAAITENENGVSMFDQPMQASFTDKESGGEVSVIGFDTTTDGRDVILHTVDQNGNEGTATIAELEFADETVSDLLSADDVRGLDGQGLRNYLNGYAAEVDGHSVAPGEYAKAYGMVYRRAAAGMDMDQAIGSSVIPQVMTETAMQDAYAAGLGAAAQQQTAAPLSPSTTNAGVMNRSFTKAAWQSMSRQQQRTAAANMEVVGQLAKRMNATINIVDSITDAKGRRINGRYNNKTGVIEIALNADANAYAYVAMHELTHKMRNEHGSSFKTFADWVQEALESNGQNFEEMVQHQMDAYGYSKAVATEEVLCNTVPALLQSEENLHKLYQQDRTLFERIMDWVKNLINDIKQAGNALSERSKSWAQMDALKGDEDTLQALYYVMETIMQSDAETVANAPAGITEQMLEDNVVDGMVQSVMEAPVNADGEAISYSVSTFEESMPKPMNMARAKALGFDTSKKSEVVHGLGRYGKKRTLIASGRDVTAALLRKEWSKSKKYKTQEEMDKAVDRVLGYMDKVSEWFKKAVGEYQFVNLADVNEASLIVDRDSGEILFSCQVPNAEYKVNFDFTTVCRQREAVQRFVDELSQEQGKRGTKLEDITLTPSNIFKLNTILKDAGYETACLGCFVEAKRYRIMSQANTIVDEWNAAVRKLNPKAEYFNFADKNTSLTQDEIIKLDAEMEGHRQKVKDTDKDERAKTPTARAETLIGNVPEMQRLIRPSDIISRSGRRKIRETSPALESFLVSRFGTAGAKPAVGFMPYNSEIAALPDTKNLGKGKGSISVAEYLFRLGGARSNSFSDFIPTHALDYLQRTIDMAARGFTGQCYTKVLGRAMLFGMTGEKINLSVMFDIDPDVHWANAGLDADGNYIVADKARADRMEAEGKGRTFVQSFPYEEAIRIEHDPRYADNCGIIGVGYSYRHIEKMLADNNIPYVIPYHRSNMPDNVAKASHTGHATNYEPVQNTKTITGYQRVYNMEDSDGIPSYATWPEKIKNARKVDMDFDFAAAMKRNGGNAKATITEWQNWMAENNLTPMTTAGEAGHGEFDLYGSLRRTQDPDATAEEYMKYCIGKGMLPVFYEFAQMDGYYKTLFDFSVRNLATGEVALQKPVSLDFMDSFSYEDFLAELDAEMFEYNEYNKQRFGSESWEQLKERAYRELQPTEEEIEEGEVFSYSVSDFDQDARMAESQMGVLMRMTQAHRITPGDMEKVAKYAIAAVDSTVDRSDLTRRLEEAFMIGRSGDGWALMRELVPIAKDVLDHSVRVEGEGDNRIYLTGMMLPEENYEWMANKMFAKYMSIADVQADARDVTAFATALKTYRDAIGMVETNSNKMFDEAYANVLSRLGRKLKRGEDYRTSISAATDEGRKLYRRVLEEKQHLWKKKREAGEKRKRVENMVYRQTTQLLKKLEKATDKAHVKDPLQQTVVTFLKSLNFGDKTVASRSIGDRIRRLKDVMASAQGNSDMQYSYLIDDDMTEKMAEFAEKLEDIDTLDKLDDSQLIEVNKMISYVSHVVNSADKAFATKRKETIAAAAGRFLMQAEKRDDVKDRGKVLNWARDVLSVDQMDSMHFFDRLGSAAKDMYQGLRDGLDIKTLHRDNALEYVANAVAKMPQDVQQELFAGDKAKKTRYALSGGAVELTKPQVMELYCLSKREQARGHLFDKDVGGIRVGDNQNARTVKVKPEDIDKLTATLTAQEKALADALQRYMAEECASWGNETSMQLYGYKKFGEQNYYPIRVDPDSVDSNMSQEGQQDNLYAIANMGMTKALKEKAKNALYIGDIFDTFSRHVDNMATYNAYAAPIADLVRWYNFRPGDGNSVKKMIQSKWGKAAADYIPQLIRDLNGEVSKSYQLKKGVDKITGIMKSSSVGRNARVVIQQPTAILRAGDMIDYRFLLAGMTGFDGKGGKVKLKEAIALSKKHCPIALLKSMGFFETDMGKSLRAAMFDSRGTLEKIKDEGMWLAGKMDEMTFGAIWRACEAETKALKPELAVGSDAYYEAVGKRMSEIIDYTQVVDTPLHRTQLMRNKDGLSKMITSFMSEPSKTYNMLAGAMQNLINNRHDPVALRKFGRTLSAYTLTAIVNGAAQSLIDAMRNGDDEEFWRKWGKAMFGDWGSCKEFMDYVRTALDANVISGLNPLSLIPLVKDALSLVQGYDIKRTDMQSMEKLWQVFTNVYKLTSGENTLSGWGWARQIATAVDSVTGQSFGNMLRDGYGFANLILKALGLDPISEKTETASTSVGYNNLYRAMASGNASKFNRVSGKMASKHKSSERDIDTAMAERFAEAGDEQIVNAYTAKAEGRASEYGRIRDSFVAEYSEMIGETRATELFDKAVSRYDSLLNNTSNTDEKKAETKPLKANAFTNKEMGKVFAGLANGTVSEADAEFVLSEMIADSEADDPAKTVRTNLWAQLKPMYLVAEGEEKKALAGIIKKYCGKTDKDLQKAEKDAAKKATEDESK